MLQPCGLGLSDNLTRLALSCLYSTFGGPLVPGLARVHLTVIVDGIADIKDQNASPQFAQLTKLLQLGADDVTEDRECRVYRGTAGPAVDVDVYVKGPTLVRGKHSSLALFYKM